MKRIGLLALSLLILVPLLCIVLTACGDDEPPGIYFYANPSSTVTVGTPVDLTVYGRGGVDVEMDEVEISITDNQCGAVLSGTKLRSGVAGTCTLRAEYEWKKETYYAQCTITFEHPRIEIQLPSDPIRIGDRVELNYRLDPSGVYPEGPEYVVYSVEGDRAKVEQTDGKWYLIPAASGEIEIKAQYTNGSISYFTTNYVQVEDFRFVIGLAEETAKRLYNIPLKVIAADFPNFDESKVVYATSTAGITIEGNVIKASDKESIDVWATYEYLGLTVKSEILNIMPEDSGNPITTAADLERLRDSDQTFLMLADIDLSEIPEWEPIQGFTGTLNGNGHKITGMNLTVGHEEELKGLFGLNQGTINDLTVEGTITSMGESKYIGILCGNNHGTIRNVSVSGTIDAPYCDYVGGVSGHCNNSNISGLTSDVAVTARNQVGGIVGWITVSRTSSAVVEDLTNNGEIHGNYEVGGVFGGLGIHQGSNNDTVTVRKLTNNGVVNGTEARIGGVFGKVAGSHYAPNSWTDYYSHLKLSECKNTESVTGQNEVGGIFGRSGGLVSELTQSENLAEVSGSLYVGGYAGKADSGTMRNLKNAQTVTGKAYVGGIVGQGQAVSGCENTGEILVQSYYLDDSGNKLSFVGGIGGDVTNIASCINHATIDASAGGEYVGGIAGRVKAIRSAGSPNKGNKNYGEVIGTKTVGGIAGEIIVQDGGNNDTISVDTNVNEANVTGTANYVGGIVGYIRGDRYDPNSWTTYISYLRITGSKNTGDVSGMNYVGGIIGNGNEYVSELSMCENTGDVEGNDFVGGYAGRANGTTMRLLKNNRTITGRGYVGGIAGQAGKMEECENNGTLVITGYLMEGETKMSYVGGVAGWASGLVNCTNNASIDATVGGKFVGGVVGHLYASRSSSNTITGNKNYGDVVGTFHVGGIAGEFAIQDGSNSDTLVVTGNLNEGAITATTSRAGGIFGYMRGDHYAPNSWSDYYARVKIMECKNTADVTAPNYAGGIVGYCGAYVDNTATFWDSNVFDGTLICDGSNKGEKWGYWE